jgi:hypothetical protein
LIDPHRYGTLSNGWLTSCCFDEGDITVWKRSDMTVNGGGVGGLASTLTDLALSTSTSTLHQLSFSLALTTFAISSQQGPILRVMHQS